MITLIISGWLFFYCLMNYLAWPIIEKSVKELHSEDGPNGYSLLKWYLLAAFWNLFIWPIYYYRFVFRGE